LGGRGEEAVVAIFSRWRKKLHKMLMTICQKTWGCILNDSTPYSQSHEKHKSQFSTIKQAHSMRKMESTCVYLKNELK
jgi:hypothetical protein